MVDLRSAARVAIGRPDPDARARGGLCAAGRLRVRDSRARACAPKISPLPWGRCSRPARPRVPLAVFARHPAWGSGRTRRSPPSVKGITGGGEPFLFAPTRSATRPCMFRPRGSDLLRPPCWPRRTCGTRRRRSHRGRPGRAPDNPLDRGKRTGTWCGRAAPPCGTESSPPRRPPAARLHPGRRRREAACRGSRRSPRGRRRRSEARWPPARPHPGKDRSRYRRPPGGGVHRRRSAPSLPRRSPRPARARPVHSSRGHPVSRRRCEPTKEQGTSGSA